MIIGDNRLAAAGCQLPLADAAETAQHYGMHHRAAIGMSAESDAVLLVVSLTPDS